jgi:hypothetical protein
MMLLRSKRPDAEIAICFPDFPTYRALASKTAVSFQLLGFGVYFVSENGDTTLEMPHHPISDPGEGAQEGDERTEHHDTPAILEDHMITITHPWSLSYVTR